jgi:hypothetical protein
MASVGCRIVPARGEKKKLKKELLASGGPSTHMPSSTGSASSGCFTSHLPVRLLKPVCNQTKSANGVLFCFVLFCFVLFCFKSALLEGLTRPMQDKRKAKSCPRGLNHLSRPPESPSPQYDPFERCFSRIDWQGCRASSADP